MAPINRMRTARIISQILFFLLFLYFYLNRLYEPLKAGAAGIAGYFDILELNPVINIIVFASAGVFFGGLIVFIISILLTLFFGRYFCGWVCPLGSSLDIFSHLILRRRRKLSESKNRLYNLKYFIAGAIIILAFCSYNVFGLFEPFSIMTSTLNLLLKPLISGSGATAAVLPVLIIFLLVFGLEFFHSRFYCSFICPTGAVLGLISSVSPLHKKLGATCDACRDRPQGKSCINVCETGAIRKTHGNFYKQDCIKCYNCVPACPTSAISLGTFIPKAPPFKKRLKNSHKIDVSKREFLLKSGLAAGLVLPLARGDIRSYSTDKLLVRPPGALSPEHSFSAACLRCGRCINACPTGYLQPLGLDYGLHNLKTPVMDPVIGYCDSECNACSDVCPTRAIGRFDAESKKSHKAGNAVIYRDACVSWRDGKPCGKCIEKCPVKAVIPHPDDKTRPLEVRYDLCYGCGICEWECHGIVQGRRPGIRLTAHGRGLSL